MKRALNTFLCMTVVLVVAAATLAQTNPPAPRTPGKKEGVANKKRVLGTIVSIDVASKTFVVKSKSAILTFTVDDATRIKLDGKESGLESIQSNEKVTVIYRHGGKIRVAIAVYAQSPNRSMGKQQKRPSKP